MIITLANQKGGVGKTTVSIALACAQHRKGRRVLVVDADPQKSISTWADVAAEQEVEQPTVVQLSDQPRLLSRQLPRQAEDFDVTIVDCPPRLGAMMRSAIGCSDLVVVPIGPGNMEAWALADTFDTIEEVRSTKEVAVGLLLNGFDSRTVDEEETRATLAEFEDYFIFKTVFTRLVGYYRCLPTGTSPADHGSEIEGQVSSFVKEVEKRWREIQRSRSGTRRRSGTAQQRASAKR